VSSHETRRPAPVVPLRPADKAPAKEPLWRHLVGAVLRRERLAQGRTLQDVADAARISMPYLSELERGRKEASSEVLAAVAQGLGMGLAELLALVQRELRPVRLVSRTEAAAPATPAAPGSSGGTQAGCLVRSGAPGLRGVRLAA
jgi:transcriptional regulator with XRE-family HTH domain